MLCLLNIETSTPVCSVALSVNSQVLFEKSSFDGPSHATLLGVYVEEAIHYLKKHFLQLDAVAVSSGPGSYTGLRIGVSMAKGVCYGYGIPLISVHTLEILASTAVQQTSYPSNYRYCPMLDARRMEVYAAIYNSELEIIRNTTADIVTAETYLPYLSSNKVCFMGNGAEKCKEIIKSEQAVFVDNIHPLAINMIPLAEKAYHLKQFENTAYFEPFYLKEFVATIAKNKVLGSGH